MSMDNDKFNPFEALELEEKKDLEFEEDQEIVVGVRADSKRKFSASVISRSVEEYEEHIESIHYETMTTADGVPYEVKVTVLKPELNPMELLRPAFAYTTHS